MKNTVFRSPRLPEPYPGESWALYRVCRLIGLAHSPWLLWHTSIHTTVTQYSQRSGHCGATADVGCRVLLCSACVLLLQRCPACQADHTGPVGTGTELYVMRFDGWCSLAKQLVDGFGAWRQHGDMSWPGGTGSAKELVTVAMVRGDDHKPFEQRIVRGNIDLNTPRCRCFLVLPTECCLSP